MRRVFIPPTLQALPKQLPTGNIEMLTGRSMGTTWTVQFVNTCQCSVSDIRMLIEQALDVVVGQMSTWQSESNISQFNCAYANTWHALPEPFYSVLACALTIAKETNGAFDPTIGSLVNLWGFGNQGKRESPPSLNEVKTLHAYCGWQKLQLNQDDMRVLQPGNINLDLSGIAKGYAVDSIAHAVQQAGIENYLVEVGGELSGAGIKPDGQPWWTRIETSPEARANVESIVALSDLAVATSGDYLRKFNYQGRQYAHTIDPRTGCPIDNNHNALVSVTVMHAECMVADALATAFSVMGVSAAMGYAKNNNIAALLTEISAEGVKEYFSPKVIEMLA